MAISVSGLQGTLGPFLAKNYSIIYPAFIYFSQVIVKNPLKQLPLCDHPGPGCWDNQFLEKPGEMCLNRFDDSVSLLGMGQLAAGTTEVLVQLSPIAHSVKLCC